MVIKALVTTREQNALETNLEAAARDQPSAAACATSEVTCVVDFIDMKLPDNKRKLLEAMEECMRPDRQAKHCRSAYLGRFGLMQITQATDETEVNINTQEVCPSCAGDT